MINTACEARQNIITQTHSERTSPNHMAVGLFYIMWLEFFRLGTIEMFLHTLYFRSFGC